MKAEEKLNEILEKIKPYLNNDGGDIELVKYKDNIVYIKLTGACAKCPMAEAEVKNGIELVITSEIPEVKKVIRIIEE